MTYGPKHIAELRSLPSNLNRAKFKARRRGGPVYVVRLSQDSWDIRMTPEGIRGREHVIVHPDGREEHPTPPGLKSGLL